MEKFLVETFYSFLVQLGSTPFLVDVVWSLWTSTRVGFFFFTLGSNVQKNIDLGSVEKERHVFKEQMLHV